MQKLNDWRTYLSDHWSVPYLKIVIILLAVAMIFLALYIDNPFILAGIFLYEALP